MQGGRDSKLQKARVIASSPGTIAKGWYGSRKNGLSRFLLWSCAPPSLAACGPRRPTRAASKRHERWRPGPDSPGHRCASRPSTASALSITHTANQLA